LKTIARGRIAHGDSLSESLLHPCVGREGLSLLDIDGRQCPENLRTICLVRLILDDVVHLFIKLKVIGVYGVELLSRNIDKPHRRRIRCFREPIHLGEFLGALHSRLGAAILDESSPEDEVAVGGRAQDKVAVRNFALVAGREQQKFSTLSLIWSGPAKIGHVLEPVIVDYAEHIWRSLDYHWSILGVDPHHVVNALGVRCKKQRLRVHQVFHDEHGVIVVRALTDETHAEGFR